MPRPAREAGGGQWRPDSLPLTRLPTPGSWEGGADLSPPAEGCVFSSRRPPRLF